MTKVPDSRSPLIAGRFLARNTFWNLLGGVAPLFVAVITIPFIVRGLGIDRFGVQTLVWVIIGYFSLFDFGLGRTLTKMVADKLAIEAFDDIPVLFWTTLALMMLLGVGAAVLIAVSAEWLVTSFLKIPAVLYGETIRTLWLLAAGVPIVILASALRGVLEAQQKFLGISLLRFVLGIYIYAAPLAVLVFTNDLVVITAVLLLGRVLFTVAHFVMCIRSMPYLLAEVRVSRLAVKPMLSMGGWMTVSNVISPIMSNMDRFFVGAIVSIAAVAYYATPYEMIMKLIVIPSALVGVLFPAFAAGFATNKKRTGGLFLRGGKYVCFVMFPVVLVVVAYAPEVLRLWLGQDFSANSARVMQWLGIGVLINSLAQIPFAFLQAIGRADLTAKLHILEMPFYFILFFALTPSYGIEGAAIAWTARVALDAALLFLISAGFLKISAAERNGIFFSVAILTALCGFFMLPLGPYSKALLATLCIVGFFAAVWSHLLDAEERKWIQGRLARASR